MGLWYVLHHGAERALALMSAGARRYESEPGRGAGRGPAGAVATRPWIQRIAEFARLHAGDSPEGTIFRRLLTSPLAGEPDAPPPCSGDAAGGGERITLLLRRGPGDGEAVRELFDRVYDELCAIAGRRMRSERADHTLQATALVHEAYARLVRDQSMEWESRRHFFGAAAQACAASSWTTPATCARNGAGSRAHA